MIPLTYHVLSKYVRVSQGNTTVGLIYRETDTGWCWAPRLSTDRTPPRNTWSEVIPDVEAWFKEKLK